MTSLLLRISLRGPVLTKSSAPGKYGVDAPFASTLDREDDTPANLIIPGTLLKGRIRDGLQQLMPFGGDNYDPSRWFGPLSDADGNEAKRHFATIHIGDAVCTTRPASALRTRIQLDSQLGAVKSSMMQVLESPFGPAEPSQFCSLVTLQLPEAELLLFQEVAEKAAVASRNADLKAELLAIADLLDPPKVGA